MYINRVELKEQAKRCLRGARPHPMLLTLVYVAIPLGIGILVNQASGGAYFSVKEIADARLAGMINFVGILLWLIEAVLMVGFLGYCLDISEGRESEWTRLFDGFGDALRVVWLTILMAIFIFLWTLLLVVPGIIAAYRYSMAYFLIIENPDMSAMDAIRASKEMMRGHKLDLFVLELSFLGWALLGVLTLGILYLWLLPYISTAKALFYRQLRSQAAGGPAWEYKR